MNRLALAASAFALLAMPAAAQDALCFQNETALVIAQERSEEVGMDILVRAPAKGKIKCEYQVQEGDWIIGQPDEPLWYEGLMGKYVILTRSTGPDGNLVVYDLETQGLFIDEWIDDDFVLSESEVTYWQRFEDGDAQNCPEFEEFTANGLGAVIAREQVFDTVAGTITGTGEERCSATQ